MDARKESSISLLKDANNLYQKELYSEAINIYLSAKELDPTNVDIYIGISKALIRNEEFDKAISFFEKCLKLANNQEHLSLRKGISAIFFLSKGYVFACNIFKQVYEIEKNEENLYIFLKYLIFANEIDEFIDLALSKNEQLDEINKLILEDTNIPESIIENFRSKQDVFILKYKQIKGHENKKVNLDINFILEHDKDKYKEDIARFQDLLDEFLKSNSIINILETYKKVDIQSKIIRKIVIEILFEIKAPYNTLIKLDQKLS